PCFVQAEDGIRRFHVTGVQTCALPISPTTPALSHQTHPAEPDDQWHPLQIPLNFSYTPLHAPFTMQKLDVKLRRPEPAARVKTGNRNPYPRRRSNSYQVTLDGRTSLKQKSLCEDV